MRTNPGQAAQVLDDDDEVIATVNGAGTVAAPRPLPVNCRCSVVPILKPEPGSILDLAAHGLVARERPTYETLGDIADELGVMLDDGMTAESIQYALARAIGGHRRA